MARNKAKAALAAGKAAEAAVTPAVNPELTIAPVAEAVAPTVTPIDNGPGSITAPVSLPSPATLAAVQGTVNPIDNGPGSVTAPVSLPSPAGNVAEQGKPEVQTANESLWADRGLADGYAIAEAQKKALETHAEILFAAAEALQGQSEYALEFYMKGLSKGLEERYPSKSSLKTMRSQYKTLLKAGMAPVAERIDFNKINNTPAGQPAAKITCSGIEMLKASQSKSMSKLADLSRRIVGGPVQAQTAKASPKRILDKSMSGTLSKVAVASPIQAEQIAEKAIGKVSKESAPMLANTLADALASHATPGWELSLIAGIENMAQALLDKSTAEDVKDTASVIVQACEKYMADLNARKAIEQSKAANPAPNQSVKID